MKRTNRSVALWEGEAPELTEAQLAHIKQAGDPLNLTPELVRRLQREHGRFVEARALDRASAPTNQVRAALLKVSNQTARACIVLKSLTDGHPDKINLAECSLEAMEVAMHCDPYLRHRVPSKKDLRALARQLSEIADAARRASKRFPKPKLADRGARAKSPPLVAFLIAGDAIFDAAGGYKKKRHSWRQALLRATGERLASDEETQKRLVDKAKRKLKGKTAAARRKG